MKYMGSKRAMLGNGLGTLIARRVQGVTRFVDLFAGSAAVSTYVARRFNVSVRAFDLQQYSVVLADAVLMRSDRLDCSDEWTRWFSRARSICARCKPYLVNRVTKAAVSDAREWCDEQEHLQLTKAYGGHYFSPSQAVWMDALRLTLPEREPVRTVGLAALVRAASQCAAAPGHTAQPFQPTRTAKKFLKDAWERNLPERVQQAFSSYSDQFSLKVGAASVGDANDAAGILKDGDLAFIDPPYSGVHYSRFYHVLESVASGVCGEVSGTGRYPEAVSRPRSRYSVQTEAEDALDDLLDVVASSGACAILTFPDHECSNGLSGDVVRDIASEYFRVIEHSVSSKFSTLGGTKDGKESVGRSARHHADELMLFLKPR